MFFLLSLGYRITGKEKEMRKKEKIHHTLLIHSNEDFLLRLADSSIKSLIVSCWPNLSMFDYCLSPGSAEKN